MSKSAKQILIAYLWIAIGLIMLAQPGMAAMSIIGTTGLVHIPTARIIPDGKAAFGMGYIDKEHSLYSSKYTQVAYYATVGYLPFLEASLSVTVFPGMPFVSDDYGSDKDRMISMGLRVINESRYLPSILLGGRDLYGGTMRFNALYLVMSKSVGLPVVGPLDVHAGYASDLMEAQHYSMIGLFAGLEKRLCRYLAVMGEYDTKEYNVGLRITPWVAWVNIDLVAMGLKGISGGMSVSFNL